MAIPLVCVCGKSYSLADQWEGKLVTCPNCKASLVVSRANAGLAAQGIPQPTYPQQAYPPLGNAQPGYSYPATAPTAGKPRNVLLMALVIGAATLFAVFGIIVAYNAATSMNRPNPGNINAEALGAAPGTSTNGGGPNVMAEANGWSPFVINGIGRCEVLLPNGMPRTNDPLKEPGITQVEVIGITDPVQCILRVETHAPIADSELSKTLNNRVATELSNRAPNQAQAKTVDTTVQGVSAKEIFYQAKVSGLGSGDFPAVTRIIVLPKCTYLLTIVRVPRPENVDYVARFFNSFVILPEQTNQ